MYRINFLIILLLGSITLSFALSTDRKEILNLVADSSVYNYKTGVDTYEGNVKIDQGTTHIRADKVITKRDQNHKIKEAIAYGKQKLAHYWTTPKLAEPEIHATAKIIKFYPIEENATLIKTVTITQKNNTFHGELIYYNKEAQTITVPQTENARAVIVYNPEEST